MTEQCVLKKYTCANNENPPDCEPKCISRNKSFPCSHDICDPKCEAPCKDVYSDKDCKCFITENTLPDRNGNYYETFCGFLDKGTIIPCDASCCSPKCPGECGQIEPRDEDVEHIPMMIDVSGTKLEEITPQMSIVKFMLYIIIALAIMSTVSLWA